VDADPQGSLSQGFYGSAAINALASSQTLAAIFDRGSATADLVEATSFAGLSVIRANHTLAPHNRASPERAGLAQFALDMLLRRLTGFNVILIDCPPNLYLCSWNALLAADFVVVPVPPEDFSAQGLRVVHAAVANAIALNRRLRILGHLVTRADSRLLIHRLYESKLRERFGELVFQSVIPEAVAFKVALTRRQPIHVFAPRSKAAQSIAGLGAEIHCRMEEKNQARIEETQHEHVRTIS
jgi:chromosome partitioning protein